MTRRDGTGTCEACGHEFGYALIHNGFNESAYAYCDQCGMTALFDGWSTRAPAGIDFGVHGPITPAAEALAAPCICGGRFRGGTAAPRCPQCHVNLSAHRATSYIERNAPGAAKGWRWQGDWQGLYAIIIEDRVVRDPWQADLAG
jgi:hypothetical protein